MKRLTALLMALLLIPVIAFGGETAVCPACGSEDTERFCSGCGAPCSAEEEAPALKDGISDRAAGEINYMMADTLAEKYGIQEYEKLPIYTPGSPQPMNAFLAVDREYETGIDKEGAHTLADPDQLGKISSWLKGWAGQIEEESLGTIRFVQNPDDAEILISVYQEYPFYSHYGYSREVSAYSCELRFTACRLSNPSQTAMLKKAKYPGDTISVSAGSKRYWVGSPNLEGSSELKEFTDSILSWYGYTGGEEKDTSALQRAMQERGAWSGPVDGQDTARLRFALRTFQEQYGLAPTGRADKATVLALYYDRQTVSDTAERYPGLLTDDDTSKDRICPSCGWIYDADEACAFCAHCGAGLRPVYVGGPFLFGAYEQDNDPDNGPEPIEWIVLDIQDGKALLMSRYGLDAVKYNDGDKYDHATWEDCTLRAWLNGEFMNTAFTPEEASRILVTNVDNSEEQAYVERWSYGARNVNTGNDTEDRIFLLSPHEAIDLYYLGDISVNCAPTDYAIANGASHSKDGEDDLVDGRPSGSWWTRLTADGNSWAVCMTWGYNYFTETYVNIRPALWVSLGQDD